MRSLQDTGQPSNSLHSPRKGRVLQKSQFRYRTASVKYIKDKPKTGQSVFMRGQEQDRAWERTFLIKKIQNNSYASELFSEANCSGMDELSYS